MLLSAVREGDCQPIKVQWIRIFSGFQSQPNGSVTAPVIQVLSCVFSHRADTGLRAVVVVPRQAKCLALYYGHCSTHGGTVSPNKPQKILCSNTRGSLLDMGVREAKQCKDGHSK